VVESPSVNKSQTNMPSLAERVDRHGEVHDRQGVRSANGIDRERRFLMVGRASPRCGSAEIAGHSVRCSARRGTGTRRDWQVCSRRCGRGGDCGSRRTRGGLLRFVGIRAQHAAASGKKEGRHHGRRADPTTRLACSLSQCCSHGRHRPRRRGRRCPIRWVKRLLERGSRPATREAGAVRGRSHREVSVPMMT
jgi:hypothetical protein